MEHNSPVNTRLEDMDYVDIIELDGNGINLITNNNSDELIIEDLDDIDNTSLLMNNEDITNCIESSLTDDPDGIEAIDILENEEEYSYEDLDMINDYLNTVPDLDDIDNTLLEDSDDIIESNDDILDSSGPEYSREDLNMINDYLNQEDDINSTEENTLSEDSNILEEAIPTDEILSREDLVSEGVEEEYSDADLDMINDYLNNEEVEEDTAVSSEIIEDNNDIEEPSGSEYSREDLNMINDYLNQEEDISSTEENTLSEESNELEEEIIPTDEILSREDLVSEGVEEEYSDADLDMINDYLNNEEVEEDTIVSSENNSTLEYNDSLVVSVPSEDTISTEESDSESDNLEEISSIDDDLVEVAEIPVDLEAFPNFMASEREKENNTDNTEDSNDIIENTENTVIETEAQEDENTSNKTMDNIDTTDIDNIVSDDNNTPKEDNSLEIPDTVDTKVDEEFTLENNHSSVLPKNNYIDYNRLISAFAKEEDFDGELKQVDLDYAKQLYEVENTNNFDREKYYNNDILNLDANDIAKFRSLFSYFTGIIEKMPEDVKKEFAKTHYYDMYSNLLKKFNF